MVAYVLCGGRMISAIVLASFLAVADDGKGGPLTTRWSQVSGPGNAVFANSNAVSTTVTCDRAGA